MWRNLSCRSGRCRAQANAQVTKKIDAAHTSDRSILCTEQNMPVMTSHAAQDEDWIETITMA
jgi:hypothetical protein